jgi:hypothetical protein
MDTKFRFQCDTPLPTTPTGGSVWSSVAMATHPTERSDCHSPSTRHQRDCARGRITQQLAESGQLLTWATTERRRPLRHDDAATLRLVICKIHQVSRRIHSKARDEVSLHSVTASKPRIARRDAAGWGLGRLTQKSLPAVFGEAARQGQRRRQHYFQQSPPSFVHK